MADGPALAHPEIQAQLIAEALTSATVGFLVWDESLNYIAVNDCACEILGTTPDKLLGQKVGFQTVGEAPIDEAIQAGFLTGTATVERADTGAEVEVFFVTFTTRSAGMPFMATVIHPV